MKPASYPSRYARDRYNQSVTDRTRRGEGRHVRRHHVFGPHFRGFQHIPKLLKRLRGEHDAGEVSVGDEHAVDLAEAAQNVVRPVEIQGRKDDVDGVVSKWKELLVYLNVGGLERIVLLLLVSGPS